MSIKSWLMPVISQHLLSRQRLDSLRAAAERSRIKQGARHVLHYFHQVDDPYSALAAAVLPRLQSGYRIDIRSHIVGPPADSAAPEREKLIAYSRRDAQLLAQHWGLAFHDSGHQPSPQAVQCATARLVGAAGAGSFSALAGAVSAALWAGTLESTASELVAPTSIEAHRRAAEALRKQLGHYLGATFYYGGEWYWGIDRLHHLEQRLQELGLQREGVRGLMFPAHADMQSMQPLRDPPAIDFFFSLRSPYSAIVAKRVFDLGQRTGASVRLRYLLPMAMRGLAVPVEKRRYISQDAAREAYVRGIAFGRLNDPLGRPAERGLALMPFAQGAGRAQDYVLSFMHGVWAEGIDAGSDRGLRRIVERAGLDWAAARVALRDDAWRAVAEHNRAELFALGLWGVPSFRVRDTAVWGQDRLWAIEEELLKGVV